MSEPPMSHMLEQYETLDAHLKDNAIIKERKKHQARTVKSDMFFTLLAGFAYGLSFSAANALLTGATAIVFGIGTYSTYHACRAYAKTKSRQSELEKEIENITNEAVYKQAADFIEKIYSS